MLSYTHTPTHTYTTTPPKHIRGAARGNATIRLLHPNGSTLQQEHVPLPLFIPGPLTPDRCVRVCVCMCVCV